jgi:hypothetical protein
MKIQYFSFVTKETLLQCLRASKRDRARVREQKKEKKITHRNSFVTKHSLIEGVKKNNNWVSENIFDELEKENILVTIVFILCLVRKPQDFAVVKQNVFFFCHFLNNFRT